SWGARAPPASIILVHEARRRTKSVRGPRPGLLRALVLDQRAPRTAGLPAHVLVSGGRVPPRVLLPGLGVVLGPLVQPRPGLLRAAHGGDHGLAGRPRPVRRDLGRVAPDPGPHAGRQGT